MTIELLHQPAATVRTHVAVPLRFPDGFAASADVFTFRGLADDQQHLLLGLGDWRGALQRSAAGGTAPLVRPHSERLTGDVFGSQRCDYRTAAQMLRAVGSERIRLLSNNPDKAVQLDAYGVTVAERVRTGVHLSEANARYLGAKRDHTAHTLDLDLAEEHVEELAS